MVHLAAFDSNGQEIHVGDKVNHLDFGHRPPSTVVRIDGIFVHYEPSFFVPDIGAEPYPSGYEKSNRLLLVDDKQFLTSAEQEVLEITGDLTNKICDIIGNGPQSSYDKNEIISHIHAIQRTIMAQAAARAYPNKYRLLGRNL